MAGGVSQRERMIWILLVLVLTAISVIVVTKYQTSLTQAQQRATALEDEKTAWTKQEADLTSQVAELTAQIEKDSQMISTLSENSSENNTVILTRLKRQGFNGSLKDIKGDLMHHNELIPYKGVLGGTMGFFSQESIDVLSDKWVFAYFEDGHIGGCMLLQYSIDNGAISWKVIDSYLYGA